MLVEIDPATGMTPGGRHILVEMGMLGAMSILPISGKRCDACVNSRGGRPLSLTCDACDIRASNWRPRQTIPASLAYRPDMEAVARALCKAAGQDPDVRVAYTRLSDGTRVRRCQTPGGGYPETPFWEWYFAGAARVAIRAMGLEVEDEHG